VGVFTKRVHVEKYISGIVYENPGGPRPPCPSLLTPSYIGNKYRVDAFSKVALFSLSLQ